MKLNTYINFAGDCAEGLAYYEKNLGAKVIYKTTFADMPDPQMHPGGIPTAFCTRGSNSAATW